MEYAVLKLDLRSPLFYTREKSPDPFSGRPFTGESLFCFEVNPDQGSRIDPEGETYLGDLICGGSRDPKPSSRPSLELPTGKYLFCQIRSLLGRETIIEMAMEIQKEGLWERLRLGRLLYLRYLFEDLSPVTQVFRPFIEPG
ncbi:MAG: hypothetical protein LBT95_02020 [Treponema sp.]|jgi:hypothetical protein|nr:hypothetical protein [Treponema sp.]